MRVTTFVKIRKFHNKSVFKLYFLYILYYIMQFSHQYLKNILFLFFLQCQEVVVPVYSCMQKRTLGDFAKCCCIAMSFLVVIYSIIGCFGYLTFGSLVSPNVMKMYDASDPIVMIGIAALIIKMVVTYPVLALCGR